MRVALCLTAILVAACSPGGTVKVALSWQFADGRDCASAGTPTVGVLIAGAAVGAPSSCYDGVLSLDVPAAGADITAAAQSPQGAPLYRGELLLTSPVASAASLVLRFTGGR